jgi:tRNA (guanine-N7-)-methyltransferase
MLSLEASAECSLLPTTKPDAESSPACEVARPAASEATENVRQRHIRSFVVRAGRMTQAQERAWRELWPRIGVERGDEHCDLPALFGREAPVVLEVGFGNGETLAALAAAHPERNYLGLEVHPPGVGHLLLQCEAARLDNVRIVCDDAVDVLQRRIADATIDELLLYFPDPWPKKRHHKRRIVQPAFLALVARKLKPGGVLRMATDWQPYAEHMLATASECDELINIAVDGRYVERPASRPLTRFERRGQRLGHGVWDLAFTRC